MSIRRIGLFLIAAIVLTAHANAADRTLTHVAVIDAPVADVWRAFTVPAEMKQWMVAEAKVDLRIGGAMTTSYLAGSTLDDEHTIVNRILSFEPERMLSIQNVRAPAAFDNAHLFHDTWSVMHFEPISASRTRVRSVGFGYGEGPVWDDIYSKFIAGNTYTFQKLQEHFSGEAGEVLVNPTPEEAAHLGTGAASNDDRRQAYLASIAAANHALQLNNVKDARRWLHTAPAELRGWEWRYLDSQSNQSARTIASHAGIVQAAAVSPDGAHIATASADQTIALTDAKTGDVVATLRGHTGIVYDVAFSHNGSLIATASRDKTVRIWNAATHELIRTIDDPDSHIMSVAFSPDDSQLAGSLLSYVKVWDVKTGETIHTMEGHVLRPPVVSVAWSHDGTRIASGSWDNWVIIWDAATGEPLHKLGPGYGAEEYVQFTGVAFSPDDSIIAASGSDKLIRLWNAASGEEITRIDAHGSDVFALNFSPDGLTIASAGKDGLIKLWDVESREQLATLRGHAAPVRTVAFTPDGSSIISGDERGVALQWDAEPMLYADSFKAQPNGIWGLDFTPNGKYLVTASAEQPHIWDVASRTLVSTLEGHTAEPAAATFAPDNQRVATAANDGFVRVFNLHSGDLLWESEKQPSQVQDVEWSNDGTYIAGCTTWRGISVWRGDDYAPVWQWEGARPRFVAFSPDSTMIAAGCEDSTVRIWSVGTFELLHELKAPEGSGAVQEIVFSPDNRTLGGSTGAHTIVLWDVATQRQLHVMEGLDDTAWDLEFLPDGSRLVSAAYDSTVRLWDPATGNCTLTIHSPEWVWTLAVSPDGSTIAWCPVDGRVVLSTVRGEADDVAFGAMQDNDDETNLDRTIELLHRSAGGEWIHESEAPDGSVFRVRNVIKLGPDGKSLSSDGWLGSTDGMYYHGATLINREPGTDRIVFRSINENGAVAEGEIRAIDDRTLHWDWAATTLDGAVTTYDVRMIFDEADPDTYRFVLSSPTENGLQELVNISYTRVNEAPERFRIIRDSGRE